MEIKGFSQCIAANKQHACGLAAAASCGMVAACEFFVCKLDFSLVVAACLLQTVAACLLQTSAACLLQTVAACLLQTAAACLLQTVAVISFAHCEYINNLWTCISYNLQ